jgi:hypothetical protein
MVVLEPPPEALYESTPGLGKRRILRLPAVGRTLPSMYKVADFAGEVTGS